MDGSFHNEKFRIFHSPNQNAITLIDVLDQTQSANGSRMLRRWLSLPLKNTEEINQRHEIVERLINEEYIFSR